MSDLPGYCSRVTFETPSVCNEEPHQTTVRTDDSVLGALYATLAACEYEVGYIPRTLAALASSEYERIQKRQRGVYAMSGVSADDMLKWLERGHELVQQHKQYLDAIKRGDMQP